MNLASAWSPSLRAMFRLAIKCRRFLPKKTTKTFGPSNGQTRIEHIYVINLTRQSSRWREMEKELKHVLDISGNALWNLTERYAAVDAISFCHEPSGDSDINPTYTLEDQLFVEPQPLTTTTQIELDSQIQMSRPEFAVARSHIEVWRRVAESAHEYSLILEDDVWFRSSFTKELDQAWNEIMSEDGGNSFDLLYLSYEEVKNGAPKTFLSNNVFRPIRGLWHLSGYVVSRKGAEKLLRSLPCRGPVDLWINHQFKYLDVRALKQSVISQRNDISSSNLYSILPALTKIGAITSEKASLFHLHPIKSPVFAFGTEGSGLSSLAMALSMLGYRCCSDLQTLPTSEIEMLFSGKNVRVFDAYVNIKVLYPNIQNLRKRYPHAKFIITSSKIGIESDTDTDLKRILNDLNGVDIALLPFGSLNKWKIVCEYLGCAPPICSFPELTDLGQRQLLTRNNEVDASLKCQTPKRDKSPWVVGSHLSWRGVYFSQEKKQIQSILTQTKISTCVDLLDTNGWLQRNDTFTDNLALFRPYNIMFDSINGVILKIKRESLGVRRYSAASLTSRDRYLYGRFEATIKASNVSGIVTGFFLHRDSPRQEIDIEIVGNRPDRLVVNVFYNPGNEGANFDYGYRGAPSYIDLGFDASKDYHRFAIEWYPGEIRWFVDDHLVHKRVEWDPTPIPHLPMGLHINAWPSRSSELAGKLVDKTLPATTFIKSIIVKVNPYQTS